METLATSFPVVVLGGGASPPLLPPELPLLPELPGGELPLLPLLDPLFELLAPPSLELELGAPLSNEADGAGVGAEVEAAAVDDDDDDDDSTAAGDPDPRTVLASLKTGSTSDSTSSCSKGLFGSSTFPPLPTRPPCPPCLT